MPESTIQFYYYPRSDPPPQFASQIASIFREHEPEIGTEHLDSGLKSDEVLEVLRPDLEEIGFNMETGKTQEDTIERPVLFGKDGDPDLKYEVDGYQPKWECGLEIEAGRAWKGNAVYRDLVQAMVMVQVDTLALAVPNAYKYGTKNRTVNPAFEYTRNLVETLFRSRRFGPPYDLLLIGY